MVGEYFDFLLSVCTLPLYFVQTGGSSTNSCEDQSTPCGSFNQAITACDGRGSVCVLGSSFSNGNVAIPAGSRLVFCTYFENIGTSGKSTLTYSATSTGTFFTVTTGQVTITNLTISFSSSSTNERSFLSLTGGGWVVIANSSISNGGNENSYSYILGVTGNLIFSNLTVSALSFTGTGSFLSAENGLTVSITNCNFTSITSVSTGRPLILDHRNSNGNINVSITNSTFNNLEV
jgi:hypothetical protein